MEVAAIEKHYRTLGVKQKASQQEIRKAFLALAVQFHPDKAGGSAEQFQRVHTAYKVLSDKNSRAAYDEELNKHRSKLRNFKRPLPLDEVRFPVHYKLADDEYYTFESAPNRLKCTFKHGDLIKLNNQIGCFVGLAADNYLYWCQDGHSHASKLCEKGSFGEDIVNVVARANFNINNSFRRYSTLSLQGKKNVTKTSSTIPCESAEKTCESSLDDAPASQGGNTSKSSNVRPLSEAERLRQRIMRRERLRYLHESMVLLVQREEVVRERIIKKMEMSLESKRQELLDFSCACHA